MQTRLPWDVTIDAPKFLGDDAQFFESSLKKLGHDSEMFFKLMAAEQIASPEFQDVKLAEFAQGKASTLIQTLDPHLFKLTKHLDKDGKQTSETNWITFLERAFQEAVIIKQNLNASVQGPFEYERPKSGARLDASKHKTLYTAPGDDGRILHTILPAVWRVKDDTRIVYSKALVVPVVSPSVQQD